MNLKDKKGITLLVLVITIILILILAGAVISNLDFSTENAHLSNFANNISQIQDSARSMYILENKLPVANNAPKLTREDLISFIDEENQNKFIDELNDNGESENAYFYQIDLAKAGVDKTLVGSGKDGEDDIYVISMNSLKVYYLRGVEYNNDIYFSINSKLANIVKLPSYEQDLSEISINTFQAVTVTKSKNGLSNELGIKIIANMDLGEKLKVGYNGIDEKTLLLPEGQTILEINNITDFNEYLDEPFSESEISLFNGLTGDNKAITLTKYYNNDNIGSTKIDVSNYDNIAPTIQVDDIKVYDEFYLVNGVASDGTDISSSKIAYVKYELDDNSNVTSDEKISMTVTTDENGAFSLKVPKNSTSIKIIAIDKVGNTTQKDVELMD